MFQQNISLLQYNTFKINANAAFFATFNTVEQLQGLLKNIDASKPDIILGGGSNLLFTQNFNGTILKNEITGIEITQQTNDYVIIKVGAGEVWHNLVTWAVKKEYYGIENLALIPGSVGAAPVQNIGAYGVEVKQVIEQVFCVQKKTQQQIVLNNTDCGFEYRNSVFKTTHKNEYVITHVSFKLHKKAPSNTSYDALATYLTNQQITNPAIHDIYHAVIAIRSSKLPDPNVIGNAGSFFKNPVIPVAVHNVLKEKYSNLPAYPAGNGYIKLAAGWLIEQCGFKGYRNGDAGCYDKQALVIVNYGNATGTELFTLSQQIISKVQQQFGIILEREVNII
jgi:UDP-N-acetylmuramate dehydrogenase